MAVAVDINWLANGGQIGRENNGVNPRTGDVEKDAVQPWRARRATAHSDIGVGCGNGIAQRTNRCIPRGVGGRIDDDAHEDRMRRRSHKQPGTQQGRDKKVFGPVKSRSHSMGEVLPRVILYLCFPVLKARA